MDVWNNEFVFNTIASELATLICTFPFQRAHGDLIPVLYLLCHYTPTIEVYWNGSMLFCVSVRIIKEVGSAPAV